MGDMKMKLADKGASGGALGGASRDDLERGFTRLHEAETPDPFDAIPVAVEGTPGKRGQMTERPLNQSWTEHDAGGFLDRAHGHER